MNNSKVLNIVKETLERDGVFVSNSKIDSVIKKYLSEREEMLLDDESHLEDSYSFSKESKQIFSNTVNTLKDTVEDLNIIQVKEGDVLINTDVYSEEYLESIMNDLEDVIERLEFIKGLE